MPNTKWPYASEIAETDGQRARGSSHSLLRSVPFLQSFPGTNSRSIIRTVPCSDRTPDDSDQSPNRSPAHGSPDLCSLIALSPNQHERACHRADHGPDARRADQVGVRSAGVNRVAWSHPTVPSAALIAAMIAPPGVTETNEHEKAVPKERRRKAWETTGSPSTRLGR
jgi:hypothetical protein